MARITDLELLHPQFSIFLKDLLEDLETDLPTLQVFESIRTPERQNELFAQGRDPNKSDFGRRVTNAKAYQSAHQYGMAVDLVFKPASGWTWDEPKKGDWKILAVKAKKHGLEQLSFEQPHVQLAGFDWKTLTPGPLDDEIGWRNWLKTRRDAGKIG